MRDRTREGKGFSRDELKEAGIDRKHASRLRLPVDLRRKTRHAENIKLLKRYLKNLERPAAPRKRRPDRRSTMPAGDGEIAQISDSVH